MTIMAAVLALLVVAQTSRAATYFLATNGSDANPGMIAKPFATIQHAQKHVQPGDTVLIRGGVYKITESQIAQTKDIWAHVILLDKNGSPGRRINYWAYQDENPVFDFSAVRPKGLRIHAF